MQLSRLPEETHPGVRDQGAYPLSGMSSPNSPIRPGMAACSTRGSHHTMTLDNPLEAMRVDEVSRRPGNFFRDTPGLAIPVGIGKLACMCLKRF